MPNEEISPDDSTLLLAIVIFIIPMLLLIVPASALFETDIVIQQKQPASSSGSGMNQTINLTANMTANMTAGLAATIVVNETFAGAPGSAAVVNNIGIPSAAIFDFFIPEGLPGTGSSDGWNITYFLNDASRPLTGEKIKRDVDNDLLSLYGGNSIAGGTGGILSLYGKDTVNPNSVEIVVGDGGIANTLVTGWVAGANPRMDMNGFNISSLLDPIADQDAATRNWVLVRIGNATSSSGINGTYYILLDPTSTFVGINNPTPRWALDVVGIVNSTNIWTNESFGSVSLGVTAGKGNSANYSTLVGEYAGYPVGAFLQTATGLAAGYLNTGNYQTATGSYAGWSNTGSSQTATGMYAGWSNTGNYQTATGYYAGQLNTGSSQTATGSYAGWSNTGNYQTATGMYAGRLNTGNSQTATGLYAGHANTGTSQTATGSYAGWSNTGSNATEIGVYSGYQNSGANLVAIGNFSGYQNTGNNVTAIGSNAGAGNSVHNIFILMQREANRVALIQGNFTSGQVQFPNYGTGVAVFDAFGNISSNTSYATTTYIDAVNTSMRNNVSANFAPIVGGKVPTVNLGGAGADATTYLRGDQTWATPATGGGIDPTSNLTTLILSDFYEATVNTLPQLEGAAISSGTIGTVATDAQHPGVIYMRDSTTANGGYRFGCVGTQLIGGGEVYEVVFQPVGVRTGQSVQMGWSDTAAAGTAPVDGVWFNITGTGAAITLRGNTSSNSVRSGTSTTYTPTTATWYRGTIVINSAASLVTYTIYNDATGATLWTSTVNSNIPTGAGRDTSPCIIVAQSSTDAAADILRLDYTRWAIDTTARSLVR